MVVADLDREWQAQQFSDWCAEIGLSPDEVESFIGWEQDKADKRPAPKGSLNVKRR